MQTPAVILLIIVAVGCFAAPVSVILSRRRVFDTWAKVAAVLVGIFGLIWTVLAFSLLRMGDAASGPTGVALTHARTLAGGVCIGLIVAVLIARPYKRVTS
jgi:FtsH-binding integral membrane protein